MKEHYYIQKEAVLMSRNLYINGNLLYKGDPDNSSSDFLGSLYRFLNLSYPKFFKMDMLSKTLFLCSEALFQQIGWTTPEANVSLVFFNSHSSLETDKQFQKTIKSDDYYPSPSLFIYTLPNIALAEVAIRNGFIGENCIFMAPYFDAERCIDYVNLLLIKGIYRYVLCGWFDYVEGEEEAKIYLISKDRSNKIFNINNL